MKTQIKTSLFIVVTVVASLSLGAQNNNQQQTPDPNAPRGAISGNVIEQGRGIPVKKATVQLTRVNNNNQAAAQVQSVPVGAAGTTANQGASFGGLVGATAAGQQQQPNRGNTNQTNQTNNNNFNNNNQQGGRGGFNGGGTNMSVQTGNDGMYVFNDVPAGEYTVTVSLDQYLTQEYGQRTLSGKGNPITLQPGERLDTVNFQMIKAGVISGTVVDEDGQPMPNVQVQALTFEYRQGQRSLRPIGTTRTTNDLGEYRLYYLTPGDYYITARVNTDNFGNRGFDNIRGLIESLPRDQRDQVISQIRAREDQQGGPGGRGPGGGGPGGRGADIQAALMDVAANLGPNGTALRTAIETQLAANDPVEAYAPAYYPGTMDPSQAAAVQLPPAGDIRGVDFSVRSVPTVTLSGVILQPSVVIVPRNQNANNNNNNNNNNNRNNNNATATNNNNNNNRNNTTAATNNNNNNNNRNNNTAATNNNNNNNRGNNNNNNNNNNRGNQNNNQAQNNNNNRGTQTNQTQPNIVRAEVRLVPIGTTGFGRGGNRGGGDRGGRGGGGFQGGGGSNNPVTGRTQINNDGTFQLTGVIPGAYNLVAVGRVEDVQVTATQKVDVGYGGNITGLTLALRPGIRLPGQIYLDGQAPANFTTDRLQVQLDLVDDLPNVQNARAQVNPDGTFFVEDVVPGARYRVRTNNVNGGYVQAGVYGNENALNTPIVVENEGTSLQLQVAFAPGNIQGTVMDRDKPQRGILTVLVPKDRGRIDLYRTASSGAEGKVTFSNVPPGDYKIFAWEEVKDGAWQDPLYMEKFEDKGRLVRVEKAGASTETIDIIKSVAE